MLISVSVFLVRGNHNNHLHRHIDRAYYGCGCPDCLRATRIYAYRPLVCMHACPVWGFARPLPQSLRTLAEVPQGLRCLCRSSTGLKIRSCHLLDHRPRHACADVEDWESKYRAAWDNTEWWLLAENRDPIPLQHDATPAKVAKPPSGKGEARATTLISFEAERLLDKLFPIKSLPVEDRHKVWAGAEADPHVVPWGSL